MKSIIKKRISIIAISLMLTAGSASCGDKHGIEALIHMANEIMALIQNNVEGGIKWAGDGIKGSIDWLAHQIIGTYCGWPGNNCDTEPDPDPGSGWIPTGFTVLCSRTPPVTTGLNL